MVSQHSVSANVLCQLQSVRQVFLSLPSKSGWGWGPGPLCSPPYSARAGPADSRSPREPGLLKCSLDAQKMVLSRSPSVKHEECLPASHERSSNRFSSAFRWLRPRALRSSLTLFLPHPTSTLSAVLWASPSKQIRVCFSPPSWTSSSSPYSPLSSRFSQQPLPSPPLPSPSGQRDPFKI